MEGDKRLFTIAVTLLPRRTQPMADNYRGWQSRTGGGTIYFTRPFQVPEMRTARGQHGPAARQSRVRFPATDLCRAETRDTSLKLCSEADCTICSTLTRIEGQHRRGSTEEAMRVGMDVILPLVQHLHALTYQFKTSKRIDNIGLS